MLIQMNRIRLFFVLLTSLTLWSLHGQTISTVAGGSVGDGGPANLARVAFPNRSAVDAAGNLYIADLYNNRIRRVDAATQIITAVAGSGIVGFSGDGGPATAAALSFPWDVAVDASGNLYIADTGNERIRRVDAATGIITTVAGSGTRGFSGDGGPATAASFFLARGVKTDAAGNIYIADTFNGRIRKLDRVTGAITIIAGKGGAGFSGDGGAATDASLAFPLGVAVDAFGTIYVADTYNQRIRALVPLGRHRRIVRR